MGFSWELFLKQMQAEGFLFDDPQTVPFILEKEVHGQLVGLATALYAEVVRLRAAHSILNQYVEGTESLSYIPYYAGILANFPYKMRTIDTPHNVLVNFGKLSPEMAQDWLKDFNENYLKYRINP